MAIDRRRANLDQRPTDDCRVLDGTGDTIKAAEEEYRRADAENYRKRADYRKDTHIRLRCARLLTTRGKQYVAQYAVCVTFILSNSLDGVAFQFRNIYNCMRKPIAKQHNSGRQAFLTWRTM